VTIYTKKQLVDEVLNISDSITLQSIIIKTIDAAKSKYVIDGLSGIILNTDRLGKGHPVFELNKGRVLPEYIVERFIDSEIHDYTKAIIEHVDGNTGNVLQARDILLHVVSLCEKLPYFYKGGKVCITAKREAGYILCLAGYTNRSTFCKTRKITSKGWSKTTGFGRLTVDERVKVVVDYVRYARISIVENQKSRALDLLSKNKYDYLV